MNTDLFRRFALSLILVFALFLAPHCVSNLIVSNAYAVQPDNEAAIAEEEQALPEAAQKNSEIKSDTEKDPQTKNAKTKESANVATMSLASGTGGGSDNIYGTLTAITDITQLSGAALAKVVIEVPPGRLGMAPQLSFSYNSYRGNGWIGVGWNIDMGSIQRSTKYGVNYNTNAFVSVNNGSSTDLVLIESNCYREKIEGSLTRYCYNTSNAPGGWEVTTKDGTKYYYGSISDGRSRQNFNGGQNVFKWCLDRVQDVHGNYMTISYTKDNNGEIYLDRIDYAGNGSTSPTNYVKFYLEDRPDIPILTLAVNNGHQTFHAAFLSR